jgi:hypothetical protein
MPSGRSAAGARDLFATAREASVKTMIFDVEPLVAPWHSRDPAGISLAGLLALA